MIVLKHTGRRARPAGAPRIGLFGILGAGNIGNDAQMEAVLRYLQAAHPDAKVDAMCTGPERLMRDYGIEAIPLLWRNKHGRQSWQGRARQGTASRGAARRVWPVVRAVGVQIAGKGVDAFRTASWVRRHDAIIVPGAGVLETSMPLRPWETPYAMFLLAWWGRLFGTKVAFVSVGANVIRQPVTRWLSNSAARLASYRSYRDTLSRDAMRQRGLDTTRDSVYSDLVFGLPLPPCDRGDARTVGVGLMAYYGTNDDRKEADELHASYIFAMKRFLGWLLDSGLRIRLLVGDTNGSDGSVVREIVAGLHAHRPDLDPERVVAEPISSFADLARAIAPVGTVVATRYHNVLCALKLCKPTISIGYSGKHDILMAGMGMSEYCQSAESLDVEQLIKLFKQLQDHSVQLRQALAERNAANERLFGGQVADLSATLFPPVKTMRHAVITKTRISHER